MRVLVLVLALFSFAAAAQTSEQQQIQAASPQLVVFAGSDANLQSLVNGLSLGQAVTIVTQTPDGLLQIATFTPPSALGSDVARALEQARTTLIARGVTQPTAQQIAVALMGGTLTTSSGLVQVPGVLTNTTTGNGVAVRNEFTGGLAGSTIPFGGSVTNFQALSNGLRQGSSITLRGTVNGVAQTVTFTPPGGPRTAADTNQLLQLANQTLAAQGILNPSPQQIQAAIVGGTIAVPGGSIQLQGVVQTAATSASPVIGNNPIVGAPSAGAGSTVSPIVGTTPSVAFPDGVRRPSTAEGGATRGPTTGR